LTGSFLHKWFLFEPIKFREPFIGVQNDRLQKNTIAKLPNSHFISFKPELAWKSNGLAAAI